MWARLSGQGGSREPWGWGWGDSYDGSGGRMGPGFKILHKMLIKKKVFQLKKRKKKKVKGDNKDDHALVIVETE